MKLRRCISFFLTLEMNVQFKQEVKMDQIKRTELLGHLYYPVFCQKLLFKKYPALFIFFKLSNRLDDEDFLLDSKTYTCLQKEEWIW